MMEKQFNAMWVRETENLGFTREIISRSISDLPDGELLIQVHYSSLNYKDALSANGNRGVTRKYPHTPGIDAAGVVVSSESDLFAPGDSVVVTSYDLGMNTSGGFGQYIRVPEQWVVKLPQGLTTKESMCFGTAGLTAGLSIHRLEELGASPENGEILVTGATGGVGSMAVAILSKLGYQVVGVSGKPDAGQYLKNLGAKRIITREEATDRSGKPILKGVWAGVIDTVGGDILTTAVKSVKQWGTVVICGNAASPDLPINVFPFILRGIDILGIDSQNCPMELRSIIWSKLAGPWKIETLEKITSECTLMELNAEIDTILAGGQKGRKVVNMKDT